MSTSEALKYDPGFATAVKVHLTFDKDYQLLLRTGLFDLVGLSLSDGHRVKPRFDSDFIDIYSLEWDEWGSRRCYSWTLLAEAPFRVPDRLSFETEDERCEFGREFDVIDITIIVQAPATSPPSPLAPVRFSPTLPVGSKIQRGDDRFTYRGCSMDHDFVLADSIEPQGHHELPIALASELTVVEVAPDYGLYAADGVEDYPRPFLNIRTDFSRTMNLAMFNILARLSSATIRGRRVMELLRYIRNYRAEQATVMVVGGAVRDAILDHDINDIDLAVNLPYDILKDCIIDFFRDKEYPVIASAPNVHDPSLHCDPYRKRFGMLKVMKMDGDPDHLDVGVFKCTDDRRDTIFGYSPIADAFQRDYTINAVYLDVFKASFYDPFGALKHIVNATDGRPMQFFPVAKFESSPESQRLLLANDFGACVRVFKMLTSKSPSGLPQYVIEAGKFRYFVFVFESLVAKLQECVDAVDNPPLSDEQVENVRFVLRKVATKLFKADLKGDRFYRKATELLRCIKVIGGSYADRAREPERETCSEACDLFWGLLIHLARRLCRDRDVFRSVVPDESPKCEHIYEVLCAISRLEL